MVFSINMKTKTILTIANIFYFMVLALFLIDGLTNFDVKSQFIKTFIHFGILIGTTAILIWNAIVIKPMHKKLLALALPVLALAMIFILGPTKILFAAGAWRTQTILYQNKHLNFNRVEFQMQDIGALGYNRRTVQVLYLTPLFMITTAVPQEIDKHAEWKKVDREVNELGLKFP